MILPPQGIITAEKELQRAVDYILTQDAFVYDVEAAYEHRDQPHLAYLTWISIATKGCCIVVPFGHERGKQVGTTKEPTLYKSGAKAGQTYNKTVPLWDKAPPQLDRATVFKILEPLFRSNLTKIGHDLIYDLVSVAKYLGFIPYPPYHCTKTGAWMLNENSRRQTWLKEMIEDTYGVRYDHEGIGKNVEDHPYLTVAYYSYSDAKWDFLIYKKQKQALHSENLGSTFALEMKILNTLCGMRLHGARVDVEALESLKITLSEQLGPAESEVYRAAGKKFNINSTPQKQQILFGPKPEGQGLRPWKLTKAGFEARKRGLPLELKHFSTDDSVLESYPDNAVAAALRTYGDIKKILSTYVDGWLGTPKKPRKIFDNHIHAGFLQYGTRTGRFSSRAPNLQNIPRSSTELGKMVRNVFIAEPGGKLIVADYSQMELVILAHYIGEGKLYEAFMEGIDPHRMTAAMVLGKDPADVTAIERQDLGKTLGFAVVYGAGLGKVASMAHLEIEEAKRVLRMHEKMFPEIHSFKQDVLDLARSREPVPYITTLLGRRRRIQALNSEDNKLRLAAERQMFNSLIQGGLADLNKLSMVRLDAMLPTEASITLTVHDEIVTACPAYMANDIAEMVREAMIGPGIQKLLRVPMKIELAIGDKWGSMK